MNLDDIKRCELCGCPLEYTEANGSRFVFTAHTTDFCGRTTAARIKAMQQVLEETLLRERATYESMIELGKWISCLTRICEAGRKWLAIRRDIDDSGATLALTDALEHAISQVEIQNKRT
jgi:hypothetical protein